MARRRTPAQFDPNSFDATLATIIAKLDAFKLEVGGRFDAQDCELTTIKEQVIHTNGRVKALELWRDTSKAKLAGVALAMGAVGTVIAWLAGILLK